MEFPSQMILFAKVVEKESFSAAARALGQSPSAVSRQIGQLEDRVGVRLLNRTQRGIVLTEEGRVFHRRCADIAASVADAEDLLESMGDHPTGVLRVEATVAFGKAQLLPLLPEFLHRYPEVRLALELSDRPIDLASDEIDLAIRFTEQVEDPSAIVRKLASNKRVICASPAYIERCGLPERPEDLRAHNCLRLSTVASWNEWHFEDAEGRAIDIGGNFEANSADAVYHAVLAGLGLARLSTYLVGKDIESGRLLRVLPEYTDETSNIVAIYSAKRNLSPKVRAFLDYLADHFGSRPPWER